MKKMVIIFLLCISSSFASLLRTEQVYSRVKNNPRQYDALVRALLSDGYPFAAIAFAKEYLSTTRSATVSAGFNQILEDLVTEVGVRQFETLPENILKKSNGSVINYIRAKKFFRRGKYKQAYRLVSNISKKSTIKPFAKMIEASIFSIEKRFNKAVGAYDDCVDLASSAIGSTKNKVRRKQFKIVEDYCVAGIARSHFAKKNYEKAELAFLDLEKSSFVWPEILFEEAWNSFYRRNYNRTLGKLVTYKAPVFDHFFIPEIDVLRAMTYLSMCLYPDAKKTVDDFYMRYLGPIKELQSFIKRKGKDFSYFYKAAKTRKKNRIKGGALYNKLLKSVVFEPGYQELNQTMEIGIAEFRRLKAEASSRAKLIVLRAVKDSVLLQKRLIGSYVRKQIIVKYALLKKAFTQMSYIKLEVLSRSKSELYYRETDVSRGRGDIKYLERNEKQYFWTFNGEFWADELGDYVFALKSECR